MHLGLPVSIELCVKALQLPKHEYPETKTAVCKTMACLLLEDLEVLRACQLTEFLLSPSLEVFAGLEDLYERPDQKYDEENAVIPNSLRCELLLAFKAHWPFDPEFWDWKTLKRYCMKLIGLEPEEEDCSASDNSHSVPTELNREEEYVEDQKHEKDECTEEKSPEERNEQLEELEGEKTDSKLILWTSERSKRWQQYKVHCEICQKDVIETRLCHHARKHVENGMWTCPVCLKKYPSREEFSTHSKQHLQMPPYHLKRKKVKNKVMSEGKLETSDPSLDSSSSVSGLVTEPTAIVPNEEADDDDDDYITFDYIDAHYKLQDREVYVCPASDCSRNFKLFKYLGVHLRNDHDDTDPNVKHYIEMTNRREKCTFCRRTFITAYHHQKHRRIHYGDCPYTCVVAGCNARFESINKLVMHKHKHGFRLSYHCELKGCSISFCDLGQLYHHEAQHFRDAAYTCTSPGCKKFYYSRQEFLMHMDTHAIILTEKDFEAQRKARGKRLLPVIEEEEGSKASKEGSKEECLNGEQSNLSSAPNLGSKDPKGLPTCVAVCFDGKKFTCGMEKCGRMFSRARDITRHLKIVHPGQFKKENSVCQALENENRLKVKSVNENNGEDKVPTKACGQEPATDSAPCDETPSALGNHVCHAELSGALTEIVLGLNQLSLNSTIKRVTRSSQASGSQVPHVTCPKTTNGLSQTKVTTSNTELVSHQAADLPRQQSNAQPPQKSDSPPMPTKDPPLSVNKVEPGLDLNKPFTCEIEGCVYKSVTSHALMQHYVKKHDYTDEKVKKMDIFNPLKFRPFKCNSCSKGYKEKKELKAHLLQKHNLSREAAEEQILCFFATKADDSPPPSLKKNEVYAETKDVPTGKDRLPNADQCLGKGNTERSHSNLLNEHKSLRGRNITSSNQGTSEDQADVGRASLNRRVSKRLMTKVKPDEDELCCLHKGCGAVFTKKFNLLRHLQTVHCHRSSLCWQKTFPCKHDGCNKQFNYSSSLTRHYHKEHPVLEDPIPRFNCTYPRCNATYHLKSSLVRHTNLVHQNQSPPKSMPPTSICNFKNIYRNYENSGPLVVRLQNTHRRDRSNSGCQKKLIITSSSQSLKVSKRPSLRCSPKAEENVKHTEETPEEGPDVKCVKPKKTNAVFAYRTPEEALQMCQDRCLSEAFPCMVQSCNSVVSTKRSLNRHYIQCHKMLRAIVFQSKDELFYNAEQLEVLIQKKSTVSALPDSDQAPNGVLKMKYQAEPKDTEVPAFPMSIHSIKPEQLNQEPSPSRDPSPDCTVMIGADEMLYGASNGRADKLVDTESQTQEARTKNDSPAPPLVPPPPLDLSPPSNLRINVSNGSLEPLSRESTAVSVPATIYIHTNASLTRQPLRGKNSEISEPLSTVPHPLAQKDAMVPNLGQRAFDVAAYKPLGFESSFLKLIKEKEENSQFEPLRTVTVLNPCYKPDAARRRDSFRRKYSIKENNLRSGISRTRMSRLSPLKSLLSTEECSSIQNLRFILERALMGCGDQAIKQLQFLKPVVVLERPKTSASLLDLLPSETQA